MAAVLSAYPHSSYTPSALKLPHAEVATIAGNILTVLWFLGVEAQWFMIKQNQSVARGLGNALIVWIEWAVMVGLVLLLIR